MVFGDMVDDTKTIRTSAFYLVFSRFLYRKAPFKRSYREVIQY